MAVFSPAGVPANYAELYELYYEDAIAIALSVGVLPADVEEVVADIICRFMERGDLEKYDPCAHVSEFVVKKKVVSRSASFKTYFGRFVYLSAMSRRDRLARLRRRETLLGEFSAEDAGVVPSVPSCEDSVVARSAGALVLDAVNRVPVSSRRSWTHRGALAACAASVEEYGRIDRAFVAAALGVGVSTVATVLVELREILADAGGREVLAR